MLAVGLILVLVAALALVAALVGASSQPVEFDLGPVGWEMSPATVFLVGAATVLIFVMGLELIRSGVRRANRQRRERKELGRLSEKLEAHEAEQRSREGTTPETRHDTTQDTTQDTTGDTTQDTTGDTRHN